MRQRHRVTTFHAFDNRYLRPTLSAGGISARVGDHKKYPTYPLTVLVQAYQFLWLVKYHDSYKCSHMLAIASYPSASPGWNFQERFYLAVFSPYHRYFGTLSGRLHTHHGCTMNACFPRIAATGRWVQTKIFVSVEQS